jgi:uncharacterized membrane-anchored protein YitT (DUF2179 family)
MEIQTKSGSPTNLLVKVRIKEFVFLLLGVLSAGVGLKGFLLPNKFLDGGAGLAPKSWTD